MSLGSPLNQGLIPSFYALWADTAIAVKHVFYTISHAFSKVLNFYPNANMLDEVAVTMYLSFPISLSHWAFLSLSPKQPTSTQLHVSKSALLGMQMKR